MYQSFINLLLEAGYEKYMTKIGPVYVLERGENRHIVYLTYHRDQTGRLVYARDFESQLIAERWRLFGDQEAEFLCVMIVDDGKISEEQCAEHDQISIWIQDELTGKLYVSKGSERKFQFLYEFLQKRGEEARKLLEEQELEEQKLLQEQTDSNEWKRFFTPVNMGLIVLNFLCFVGVHFWEEEILSAGVSVWDKIMIDHQYYRLVTSMFLHFDLQHLLENMALLFLIGSFVEREWGSISYGVTYLLSGLIGNAVSFYMQIGNPELIWSAGASGAVYGVLGMMAILLLQREKRQRMGVYAYPGIFILVIGGIFHNYHEVGVDNWCHLGGLAAGFIFGVYQMLTGAGKVENKE